VGTGSEAGEAVAQVRRFNRTVTQRVGALDDRFLGRERPLGEARLLWEVGAGGCDLRTLRARLDLDSGYLSRMLRALEHDGLVTVAASQSDRRVREARLTRKGRAELRVLDRRSDALAQSLLDPLTEAQRSKLVSAMRDVERLLTAALVEIDETDPGHRDAQFALTSYFAELDRRFERGFDVALSIALDPSELVAPTGVLLVAHLHGEPVGCGALRFHARKPTEIKRMWVAPDVRGLGVGRRLLTELERRAREHGDKVVRLETNKALVEAISIYRSSGYVEVPAFNDEAYGDHWFEKRLRPARAR
jgi:DNA-binding MarR family transcriptional regulator/GNAT superfamily N-acetyltransferase